MKKLLVSWLKWTCLLLMTGITAGLVAVVLIELIHFIQALSFGYSHGSFSQKIAQVHPWRRFGSVMAAGLVAGSGWYSMSRFLVPLQSIKTTVQNNKQPNPLTHLCHGLLQMTTVSMGSPLGREGASREVAVALTQGWTKQLPLSAHERSLLLGCASGAALGAVYNAPWATSIFILESIFLKLSGKTVYSAIVTAFVAVGTVRLLIGADVQYQITLSPWTTSLWLWILLVTPLLGVLGFGLQRLIARLPQVDRTKTSYIWRVLAAFFVVACLSYVTPQILGNGKAGLLYLQHQPYNAHYALSLVLAKVVAVLLTLAVGTYGGKIAPAMMIGGGLAYLLAHYSNQLLQTNVDPQLALIIGAALFLAIINDIPLAAIVFLTEISGQAWSQSIPLALAMLIAYSPKLWRRFQPIIHSLKNQ
ncbi:chloride channel protein [Streptococcus halichoeri]|uniref:chloride channel protein n=1 Tax=Streptococcus halichoeri TaxID=254785 RepID=UPI0013571E4E|nr:chloride channel protein [Streptococcus halichoeri]